MKTYIIHLEAHDDLVSARDKLKGAKARRVIFVWPKTRKVLADYYSLSLLKREADRQGVSISFIGRDAEVQENARLLGISLFASVAEAEKKPWHESAPQKIERNAPVGYDVLVKQREIFHPQPVSSRAKEFGRIVVFVLSLTALLGLGMFFYPSAIVKIYPQKSEQKVALSVRVNPSISEVSLSGAIPGHPARLELSGTKTGVSSGVVRVGVTKATGVVTVTNLTGRKFSIPTGTQFRINSAEEVTFISTGEVAFAGTVHETGEVEVEADKAGEAWNLAAGTSFTPLTSWADSVSVSNTEPFTGGTSVDSPSPTAQDYDKTRQALLDELKAQAEETITIGATSDSVLIPQSLKGELVSETRSVEVGMPSDHFTLAVKVSYSATTYLKSDLVFLSSSILDANLKPQLKPVDASLKLAAASQPVEQTAEGYSWEVTAIRQVSPQISMDDLAQKLVNMPVKEAQSILAQQVKLQKPSEVILSPGWWTTMPFVAFRITIEEY